MEIVNGNFLYKINFRKIFIIEDKNFNIHIL